MTVNNTTVAVVKNDRTSGHCNGETFTVGSEKWNIQKGVRVVRDKELKLENVALEAFMGTCTTLLLLT